MLKRLFLRLWQFCCILCVSIWAHVGAASEGGGVVSVHVINNSQFTWGNACATGPLSGEWPAFTGDDGYGFVDAGNTMEFVYAAGSVILWGNPSDNFPNALPPLPAGFSDVWIYVNDDLLSPNSGSIYGQVVTLQCNQVFRQ